MTGPTRRLAGDIALAFGAALVMVVGTNAVAWRAAGEGLPLQRPGQVGWLLLLSGAGILGWRRRWPTAVMWATIGTGFVYDALGNPGAFYTVAIGLGIYSAAAAGRRWTALAGVPVAFGIFLAGDLVSANGHVLTGEGALWFAGWMTAAALLGEVGRSRSDYIAAVEQRAVEAERSREEEARRRAGEERMRIARELHDVLAHSISIINVQAGAAIHHFDTDPEKARDALLTVRETGKEVLRELGSSLGVLRDPNADHASRAPTPGIGDIDQLVTAARQAGLSVSLDHHGDPGVVPADIGLAVYRIIQEGLTNVTRHAGAAAATVTIDQQPGELLIRVDDDGPAPPTEPADGHGITGMRERLAAVGGHLRVGPKPEGGFRVEGRIPLGDGR